jgi:hypothetical protein
MYKLRSVQRDQSRSHQKRDLKPQIVLNGEVVIRNYSIWQAEGQC